MPTPIEKIFEDVQLHVTFAQASSRSNIVTYDSTASEPENISTAFGKLSKWYEALVPTGGSSGKILTWNSSGTAKWSDPLHPAITLSADTTSTPPQLSPGGSFTAVTSVTREGNGHVTKINTATYTLPSDQNTDTKVRQSATTTEDFRPILMGATHVSGSSTGLDATVTDEAYVSTKLYCQPKTGNLYVTGDIKRANNTLSLWSGNDCAGVSQRNNYDINTWYGFSVSNACTTTGTLNGVAFSVNARNGQAWHTGNVHLYSASGDSPALVFQRGTFVDNLNDWKIYVSGGELRFAQSTGNASSETWTTKMYFHASDGNLYVGSTKVSLEGHTHNYAGSSSAGGPALSVSTAGGDVVLGTYGSSSDDSGDIVWNYGNGKEKARLWQDNTYTAKAGPQYRIYKSDGTGLYSGRLPLADGTSASGTWEISITGNASKTGIRWNAVSQGQKWSRLYYSETAVNVEGSNGILSISCTRGNVVVNAVFLVFVSHSGSNASHIIELASTNYSTIRCRVVSNSNGSYYFEIYDTANSIASGTSQTWHCCFVTLTDATLTTYTAFTDGSTIPSNFAAANDFTTTVGKGSAAIKDISRSGTTFTATRQDGTTFTFTQQDTTYSANNGVGLSGTTFYNSGVRAVSTGSTNGTISVNTDGTSADVAVKGLASAAYVTQESLLRARSSVTTDGGATGWSQIGINQYNNAYPDGVTNKIYSYGAVVSMPAPNARFDLYYNHNSSTAGAVTNGLQYRTGWDNDKKAWRMLLDNDNYGSYMTYTSNRSGYASSDTHILQLGYFVTDGLYDNCTILVSSAFWGNQHGSSDIINFQQSNNTDTTATAIHVTMSRIRIGGSVGRTFYYKADNTNNRVYLYVYVTGGNSYGRWNTTVLQSSGLTTYWRPSMSENQANSDLTEIPYTGRVDYATTATASYVLGRNTAVGLTTTGVQYAVGQLTIGSADGNAKEGSNASYKLWSYPAGGTGVSSTVANIQNLRLYWSSTYYRDIFISPNNYDIYHRAVENNSAHAWRKILDSGNYTSYTLPRNIKHIHAASGTEGSAGWVKIARITVTAAFANHPMTFTIAQRGVTQYRIHLLFVNNGSAAAAAISEFIIARDNSWVDTNNPRAYIIKPSDGIFDLYIRKTENYDHIFVVDFTKADDSEGNNYSVAWTNVHVADSAITGGTEADKKSYLSTSGGTVSGTLVLSKTQDASGTANNSPALIVGGDATSTHLELDANEIMAKTNGTSTAALYINDAGGNVYINNNLAARHTATPISGQVVIIDGTTGGIKSSGYTIATSVPSGAVFTDTKNTAGSTDTSSKIFLIGATSQAANPQTYSDDQCYVTSGTLQTNITSASAGVNANTANSSTAGGLSLYATNPDQYGVIFRGTSQKGKHGYVTSDWATYFTMNDSTTRGWVFNRNASSPVNVASISGGGNAVFNGSVTVGGNAANTSGCRLTYNSSTQSLDFIFA